MKRLKPLFLFIVTIAIPSTLLGQSYSVNQLEFFEAKIRPALVRYCYECHSVEGGDSRAGLLLDSRNAMLEGGDSGPVIVPGKPAESLFYEAICWEGSEMPPSEMMPDSVIADFKRWIEMGAPDPREKKVLFHQSKINEKEIDEGRKHWAFQPPAAQPNSTIDRLVNEKLLQEGLKPAPPADALTLLRRLNFTLIGLPPTTDEIQQFQRDFKRDSESAVEAKLEELLARDQFGERWGRHWLDVARYAESSGSRNTSFPHAWRYRDYVIDAFNQDTPYNWFLAQQIAGDLLPVKTDEQWQQNLIATGFLAIGMKHLDQKNPRKFQSDMIDEQIDTLTQGVLGLTVACARCHDHKTAPIPTTDYYAMAGIFSSTTTYYGTQRVAQNHRPSDLLLLPIEDAPSTNGTSASSIARIKEQINALNQQMSSMGRPGKDGDGDAKRAYKSVRNRRLRLEGELATMKADGTKKTFAMGVQEAKSMTDACVLIGGEVERAAQVVPRGFLQMFGDLNFQVTGSASSGREQLVKAITTRDNPLTARVMANRIWMHLIGRPIVGTPNNFGPSGMAPTNQALLDHLAIQFMQNDWSVKQLIREIVLSDVFRRSAQFDSENYDVDPDNELLWRSNPRPLEAESLRDAMLVASGEINLQRQQSAVAHAGDGKLGRQRSEADSVYRSVYLPVIRDATEEQMALFDFPDANFTCSKRSDSIIPTQALYMMNSDFVAKRSRAMASRLAARTSSLEEQVREAFLLTHGRPPNEAEKDACTKFFS
ncbi:MAG: PSD1 and planctomycete cytochrome C domain-containing protein, partial [Planctomycetota bacterium]